MGERSKKHPALLLRCQDSLGCNLKSAPVVCAQALNDYLKDHSYTFHVQPPHTHVDIPGIAWFSGVQSFRIGFSYNPLTVNSEALRLQHLKQGRFEYQPGLKNSGIPKFLTSLKWFPDMEMLILLPGY